MKIECVATAFFTLPWHTQVIMGYFPNTLAGDGDPLDVLVISEYALHPGTIINVKIVGVLLTKDEKGSDEKIIAVPAPDVDPNFSHINDINDIPKWTLTKIEHFFQHYKDTEENKWGHSL